MTRVLLCALLLAAVGCRSRTDESEGTVILSVSDFDGLPVAISATLGPFQIEELTLANVAKSPSAPTGDLQTIELRSYEVTYRRLDSGTRTPPTLVEGLFGNVPVGGTSVYNNLPFMKTAQLAAQPLLDLGSLGRDPETGSAVIPLRVTMRFFGRTLAGDDIVSNAASFDIDVAP
jgi:hypothetical protein